MQSPIGPQRKAIKIKITLHKNTPEKLYICSLGRRKYQEGLCFKGLMPEPPKFPPAHNKCPSSSTLALNPPRSVFFLQILLLIMRKNRKSWCLLSISYVPGIVLSTLHVFFPLVLTTSLQGKDYYSTHLTDEDTEAQLKDSSPDSPRSKLVMVTSALTILLRAMPCGSSSPLRPMGDDPGPASLHLPLPSLVSNFLGTKVLGIQSRTCVDSVFSQLTEEKGREDRYSGF